MARKKLRTIKDLIKDYDDTQTGNKIVDHNVYLFMRNLKQEAIRWLKELPHLITSEDWYDFFNITEEDLK